MNYGGLVLEITLRLASPSSADKYWGIKMYIFYPIIILSSTISLNTATNLDSSYRPSSPTMDQPIENLGEKQNQQLLETIFIERIKQELKD